MRRSRVNAHESGKRSFDKTRTVIGELPLRGLHGAGRSLPNAGTLFTECYSCCRDTHEDCERAEPSFGIAVGELQSYRECSRNRPAERGSIQVSVSRVSRDVLSSRTFEPPLRAAIRSASIWNATRHRIARFYKYTHKLFY